MALADDGDQVALLRVIHCVVQRIQTVGDLHKLGIGIALVHAHADVGDDVLHLLKAVVVLREDGEIGHLGTNFAHTVAAQLGAVAAAAEQGFYVLVFIALLNTIISLYYYLLVVKAMFINKTEEAIAPVRSDIYTRLSLIVCTAGILILGLLSTVYEHIGMFSFGITF